MSSSETPTRSTSRTSLATLDNEDQEDEERHYSDSEDDDSEDDDSEDDGSEDDESEDDESEDDDTDEDDSFDYSYYRDDDEEEPCAKYDDDYQEEELQHPRCIYQDIGTRDLDVGIKSQLLSTAGPKLRDLINNAQAKKHAVFEFRQTLQQHRAPDVTQDQWEQQLSATYGRQACVLLEALEADIAYFRQVLYEMVQAFFGDDWRIFEDDSEEYHDERNRIHEEIGDTRANILVVRLRADRLTKKFVDAFRHKCQVKEEDWAFVDQLIPTWRTPHKVAARFCCADCPESMKRIEQEQQKTAGEILAQWGWRRARRNGKRGWWKDHQFRPLESVLVESFIPESLSEHLTQYLFGGARGAPQLRSPQNMIPHIQLGVGTCVMAPAIENDEFLDAEGIEYTVALPSSASDKWIHKKLAGDGLQWPFSADLTFQLKEFGTHFHPRLPDRRCAYFHLLINMFHIRRWCGQLNEKWQWPWQFDVGKMMEGERWGMPAPWLRKSTIIKMAATIGHINDFGTEFEAGVETTDDDAELDMLIANIIEEHLFPSPAVFMPDESKYERLVFGETDIVAQMQRRKAHFLAAKGPGATVKCVYAARSTTYWSGKGTELTTWR